MTGQAERDGMRSLPQVEAQGASGMVFQAVGVASPPMAQETALPENSIVADYESCAESPG
jgi:hypothetical protein